MSQYGSYDVDSELDAMLQTNYDTAISVHHDPVEQQEVPKKRKLPDCMDGDAPPKKNPNAKQEAIRKKYSPFEFQKNKQEDQIESRKERLKNLLEKDLLKCRKEFELIPYYSLNLLIFTKEI
jgi:hypothetical protein